MIDRQKIAVLLCLLMPPTEAFFLDFLTAELRQVINQA